MKKIFKTSILFLITSITLILSACSSNQNMARNIDSTVTSFIYTASTLDWIDLADIEYFSHSNESNTNTNESNSSSSLNNYDITTARNISDLNSYNFDKYKTNNFNVIENNDLNKEINDYLYNQSLNDAKQDFSYNKFQKIRNNKRHINSIDNNFRYNLPKRKVNNVNIASDNTPYKNTIKNIATNNINSDYIFNETINQSANNVKNILNEIITKRSNLLFYVNHLYKGNINLTPEESNSLNAYLNIIKENTSYLNSNKGIVLNQFNQAKEIADEQSNPSLVNAYIIRTNEAISTRYAKLNSVSYAIDAILNILSSKSNSTLNFNSPQYNIDVLNNTKNANFKENNENSTSLSLKMDKNINSAPQNKLINDKSKTNLSEMQKHKNIDDKIYSDENLNNIIPYKFNSDSINTECENCLTDNLCHDENCNDCQPCKNCNECKSCDDCIDCENCIDCKDNTNYKNCDDCKDCKNCEPCDNCYNCDNCEDCKSFSINHNKCKDCNDLITTENNNDILNYCTDKQCLQNKNENTLLSAAPKKIDINKQNNNDEDEKKINIVDTQRRKIQSELKNKQNNEILSSLINLNKLNKENKENKEYKEEKQNKSTDSKNTENSINSLSTDNTLLLTKNFMDNKSKNDSHDTLSTFYAKI